MLLRLHRTGNLIKNAILTISMAAARYRRTVCLGHNLPLQLQLPLAVASCHVPLATCYRLCTALVAAAAVAVAVAAFDCVNEL